MFDPKTKVLVVDDVLPMRKVVTKILRELGFTDVMEAQDGNDAWEKIQKQSFGLIISDWDMPQCTGIELLKKVRADENTTKIPFILVTAEAEIEQVNEAIKSGVDQYVVKPFSQDGFKSKLAMAYKKANSKKSV